MIIKFNKFERVAGLFVMGAVVLALVSTFGVAVRKGWFSSKVSFQTVVESAEGLHSGTQVQMAGLRVGSVTDVELVSAKEVKIKFEVLEKFHKRIRKDSVVMVVRPFIIGDKVVDITIGSDELEQIKAGSKIAAIPTYDLMDLASGRKLGPFMDSLQSVMGNLKVLVKAFSNRERTQKIVQIFDELLPLIQNMNQMSSGVSQVTTTLNKHERFELMVKHLSELTRELAVVMPEFKKQVPNMGTQFAALVNNLATLTDEFKKLTPTISAVAPDLPQASLRALEMLDEMVITLKAMQKTFMLSGSVEEVREEEQQRKPASQK
ncbi:MAG: MlaD family protein [Bdellovibrionales bacterium]|nr:MlaD family protein [Bdellovibrionales bacterium]